MKDDMAPNINGTEVEKLGSVEWVSWPICTAYITDYFEPPRS
jgi:hypothetical protein